jgi:hypothetical protein
MPEPREMMEQMELRELELMERELEVELTELPDRRMRELVQVAV